MSDPFDALLEEAFAALPSPEPPPALRGRLRRHVVESATRQRRVLIFAERRGNEYQIVRHEESGDAFAIAAPSSPLPLTQTGGAACQRHYYREVKR